MNNQMQPLVDRVKQSNNILVTVSSNPSVDQLAACIGLTLALNKMGKHATAVFSGAVPSTIEFLQPEKTIEKNTDSLRDFIIALDKSKADKLRYKVEDTVVKIFITPYKTSISEKDLEFSQGDFNVDVVLALGVHSQTELDQAITAHGRILHDATVATINVAPGGEQLGSINWLEPRASSLSELVTRMVNALDKNLVDNQIATALLTGIVAETQRFSNEKTSPDTMSASAALMAAGANQQLVATKLEEPPEPPAPAPEALEQPPAPEAPKHDGTLEIEHGPNEKTEEKPEGKAEGPEKPAEEAPQQGPEEKPEENKPLEGLETAGLASEEEMSPAPEVPKPEEPEAKKEETPEGKLAEPETPETPQIHIDDQGQIRPADEVGEEPKPLISHHDESPKMVLQPPTLGGQLTANSAPGVLEPSGDPLSLPPVDSPLLDREPDDLPSGAPAPSPSASAEYMPLASEPGKPDEDKKPDADAAGDGNQPATDAAPTDDTSAAPVDNSVAPPNDTPVQDAPMPPIGAPFTPPATDFSAPPAPAPYPATPPVMPADDVVTGIPTDTAPQADVDDGTPDLTSARDAVQEAISSAPVGSQPLEPIQALNANPVDLPLGSGQPDDAVQQPGGVPPLGDVPAPPSPFDVPTNPFAQPVSGQDEPVDPNSPPPVPPPMIPPAAPVG